MLGFEEFYGTTTQEGHIAPNINNVMLFNATFLTIAIFYILIMKYCRHTYFNLLIVQLLFQGVFNVSVLKSFHSVIYASHFMCNYLPI